MKANHPLWELFIFRMRAMWREPAALFWTFAFPLRTAGWISWWCKRSP
jgi:hypothetical protein